MPEETNGASHPQPVDSSAAENSTPLSVSNLQQHDAAHTDSPAAPHRPYRHNRQSSQSQGHPNKSQSQYNRKNYGQKANHQNQYNNYSAAQAAQAQAQAQAYNSMYYGGYYPSNYGYMVPMPYAQAPQPGMASPTAYNGGSPVPGQPTIPQYAGKIKITDKDGKQIDLDEKIHGSTASATPVTSPRPAVASPQKAAVVKPASPVKAAAKPATTADTGVLEDFKAKIARLAAAAKAKKEAEAKAKADAEAAAAAPKVAEKEPVKPEPVPEPVKEPVPEPVKDTTPEPKVAEPKASPEKAEPVKEDTPEQPSSTPASQPVEPTEPTEPASEDKPEKEQKEVTIELPEETKDDVDQSGDDDEEGEGEGEGEGEEEEPNMNLTQFFAKLNEVEGITDPYAVEYPEPFTAVDPKWKSDTKKYRYDPQFLIQFRDVVQLDVDEEWNQKLLGLGIVATPRDQKKFGSGMQRGGSNRYGGLPGRFNSMSGRGGQFDRQNSRNGSKRRGGSSRDKSKRGPSRRKDGVSEPTIAPEDIKPLEKSANRWVPRSKTKTDEVKLAPDGVTVILSEEDIERKVKSLLNKLTLEMFEPITDDILKICDQSQWEDDAQTVKQVISLTFAKACDEPYWSSMYAQFCAKMCTKLQDEIAVEDFNGQGRKFGGDLARRLLLATCQKEYEKGWSDKIPQTEDGAPLEMMSDEYYTMAAAKRRGLGLIKFIGQLYLLNMLNDRVVVVCLTSCSKNVVDPSEDSLESLAQLITAIGPKYEQTDKNKAIMQSIFDNIQKILDNVTLSSRIKFMLMDLQDTRRNGWVAAKQESGPKTIKEIHDDAEIKRLEDEKAALERRRKNKSNDSRSNSTRGGSNWGSQPKRVESSSRITPVKDSKGFTAVQRSQSNRINDSSFTLSPRENSKRTDSVQSTANMFAALDGDDNDNDEEHENVNGNES